MPTRGDVLLMYVVYCRPADYPDEYVVREWSVYAGRDCPGALVARGLPPVRKLSGQRFV